MSKRTEWNLAAAGRMDVYVSQPFRRLPVSWSDLHYDVILVLLTEHGRNLPLTKSVVERLIYDLRRDPHSRRRKAIIRQRCFQSSVLLVAVHIRESRKSFHLLQEHRGPVIQIGEVVGLKGVLVLRVCLPTADAHVLSGLQEERRSRHAREPRPKPPD